MLPAALDLVSGSTPRLQRESFSVPTGTTNPRRSLPTARDWKTGAAGALRRRRRRGAGTARPAGGRHRRQHHVDVAGRRGSLVVGCARSRNCRRALRVADFPLPPLVLAQAAQRSEYRAVGFPAGSWTRPRPCSARPAARSCWIPIARARARRDASRARARRHQLGALTCLESSAYATRRRELEQALSADGELDAMLTRRLRHVETENGRPRCRGCSSRSEVRRVGELLREGHESLRSDLRGLASELDRLVELAYAHGAVAARMTGGGFGGSIAVLANADETGTVARRSGRLRGRRDRVRLPRADGARELTPGCLTGACSA